MLLGQGIHYKFEYRIKYRIAIDDKICINKL